ncbi:hypothetical protein M7I_3302 [Glarea lozoyensis 74030]|uniref:Inosine/uridine-preferring nucleoside hydrolase domain-containing protein n=1 Tax=Glarea lozoyensis (strain ATCC 74030 / MF5533) TaxID=1104152 RepID=H0EKP7_GLAL7|nr:hypothetical protein M7I_3302 [Glarea lozoyensis 74030]
MLYQCLGSRTGIIVACVDSWDIVTVVKAFINTQFSTLASVFLALSGSIQASPLNPRTNATEKRYAILDNDWSPAGFIPFLMALDAGIEILGIASSTANTWQKQGAYHALATLEVGNLSCIPVYYGATHPIINTPELFQAWESVHGVLPWEGAFKKFNATAEALFSDPTSGDDPNRITPAAFVEGFPNITAAGTNAAAFMIEQVRKYPGQELVIMGGYVDVNLLQTSGDYLQADINSDINLMIDPEGSKIALTADFPDIVIAGNVANQVMSTQEFLDEVYEVKNPYSELMHKYYAAEAFFPFWDETAMALLADPTINTNSSTGNLPSSDCDCSSSKTNVR